MIEKAKIYTWYIVIGIMVYYVLAGPLLYLVELIDVNNSILEFGLQIIFAPCIIPATVFPMYGDYLEWWMGLANHHECSC